MRATPGLLRLAAAAWWHTAEWAVGASLRAGSRILGVVDNSKGSAEEEGRGDEHGDEAPRDSLRERGAELLRRSADVRFDEEVHPAYERILGDLAPDEGRILRLLAIEGPQPAVDVRSGLPVVNSQLVALGLSMIGEQAGCRYLDRVHAYLNNLNRLGLIWFTREPVADRLRYQVLEAQPEVTAALREGGRSSRTVRRSIHLTPFGEDFCEMVLPDETAELEGLPGGGPGDVEAVAADGPRAPGG
jgi:hypothetical protein